MKKEKAFVAIELMMATILITFMPVIGASIWSACSFVYKLW